MDTTTDILGYVVLGDDARFKTAFRRDLASARKLEARWNRLARRWHGPGAGYDAEFAALHRDGTVSAGEPGTGFAGLGLANDRAVRRAAVWLRQRSPRTLIGYGLPREVVARVVNEERVPT